MVTVILEAIGVWLQIYIEAFIENIMLNVIGARFHCTL